jgi:GLPGLI family protein
VLYGSGSQSIYQCYNDAQYSQGQAFNREEAKPCDDKAKKAEGNYLKIDNAKKEMAFFDMISGHYFLVEDVYHEFKWDIGSEAKTIGGYQCVKAVTNYRGREWIAWFTPEIPVSFGPWKLHGLPGLIIEAYDAKNEYSYKVVKIEAKKSDLFTKDFRALVKTKNKNPISYRQFLKDRTEWFDNISKQMQSEHPELNDEHPSINSFAPELKFEWEE